MKSALLFLALVFSPSLAFAGSPGEDGAARVHRCLMDNDVNYCRSIMTPDSSDYLNRFVSYKLMPCMPTDFTYAGETTADGKTTVKVQMPAGGNQIYVVRLVFSESPEGLKLNLPATFERGLGGDWQNKLQMSEQLYVMMRQNMGDKLTCDMLNGLVKPH